MRRAVLSDIHGNLNALNAVLNDIGKRNAAGRGTIEEVICLGDIVGYGPRPRECMEIARDWAVVIKGNHERELELKVESPEYGLIGSAGKGAYEGIHWAIRQLYRDDTPVPPKEKQRDKDAWKKTVEAYTQTLLETMRTNDFARSLAETLCRRFTKGQKFSFGDILGGKDGGR